MDLDDNVCLCFRVSRRKLEKFLRFEHPKVASQLSQCGGAGTGCGWCIPFLQKMFDRYSKEQLIELQLPTSEEYQSQRQNYLREQKGAPANENE